MDFDDDFGDSFEDAGCIDKESFEDSLHDEHRYQEEPEEAPMTDTSIGLDWEDIVFLGTMSEEIAEERKRQDQILREMEQDEKDHANELGIDDLP